jgi:S-formylglutathione hydrolase FrmB
VKGAGFYLNATNEKWSKQYNMYVPCNMILRFKLSHRDKYITKELPEMLASTGLPLVC